MLFLSAGDIRACLACEAAMMAVEEALAIQEAGAFVSPDRLHMGCGDEGDMLLLMPCKTDSALAAKLVTVFPGNRERGLAAIQGLVLLCDPGTGELLAILDGKTITAIRTGALTGVSVRYLAEENVHSVGLVGCGVQAFDQIMHCCAARPIRTVVLHSRQAESSEALRARLAPLLPQVEIVTTDSVPSLMARCQVLITATSAREPVLPDDPTLFEGKHCVAIGSFEPGVREYPDAIFARTAKVWVDTPHAQAESGELAVPLARGLLGPESIETLGSLVASQEAPERGKFGTTFFKSVGMALLDLQTALAVRRLALERGLGRELPH